MPDDRASGPVKRLGRRRLTEERVRADLERALAQLASPVGSWSGDGPRSAGARSPPPCSPERHRPGAEPRASGTSPGGASG